MKKLVVTADDFGASATVNEAIEIACTRGILTSASLMVGAPCAADAVARARRCPGLRVGLHVVLTRGRSVLAPDRIPDLVDSAGEFRRGLVRSGVRFFFLPAVRRQLEAEIRAQFEAYRRTGLVLDHVDAHNHMHLHPVVAAAILRVGRDHGLSAIRIPREPCRPAWRAARRGLPARVIERALYLPWVALLDRRAQQAGLVRNDWIFGIHDSGRMTERRLVGLLRDLPDGLTEIYLHPFTAAWDGQEPDMAGYAGSAELDALTADSVSQARDASGARVGGFRAEAGESAATAGFAAVVLPSESGLRIAKMPPQMRAARAVSDAGARRIAILADGPEDSRGSRAAARRIPGLSVVLRGESPRGRIEGRAGEPLLVLAGGGYPEAAALKAFVRSQEEGSPPLLWIWRGRIVAALVPGGEAPGESLLDSPDPLLHRFGANPVARRISAPDDGWIPAAGPAEARAAEQRLFASLRKESDGYLARFDRTISIAVSRLLLETPVTPNQITAASLVVGLIGAGLLAQKGYVPSLGGAFLLWLGCILDGCDGEVARLKLLSSRWGARFDIVADNVVHVAVFIAIPIHVHRAHPEADLLWPAVMLLTGVLLSMFAVWRRVLRSPAIRSSAASRVIERVASRDFLYLVLALAVLDRLEWFLYAAAIGAHAFWIVVLLLPGADRARSRLDRA